MKLLISAICIFGVHVFMAQNLSEKPNTDVKKEHYTIINCYDCPQMKAIIEAAEVFSDFDRYRMVSKRRLIRITGTEIYIELHSAEELLERYGKQISPLNITDSTLLIPIEFGFSDSKTPLFEPKFTK